jgi:CubicO group peptidase (beta-lactamase class C family)
MTADLLIDGECEPQFASVGDAFRRNFTDRGDVGAGVAVAVKGRIVVDLWGGHADAQRSRPWARDTMPNVWSTTKGVAALCFAMLVDRGQAAYDAPVSRYWPAFAAHGKGDITIAQLLSHQAGLCGFATPAVLSDYLEQEAAEERLAAQAPFWPPGSQSGYHALSIGNLANALFRRIEGRTLATFVAEELTHRFDLELSIGLPARWDHRAAEMIAPPALSSTNANPEPSIAQHAALANTTAWRRASLPSANGFATARALARLYGALASDGTLDGVSLVGSAARNDATRLRIEGLDAVLGINARWGAGFLRNVEGIYGDSPDAFGHSGWGGSFAFADPGRGIAVAYVMNAMGMNLIGDPRAMALVSAAISSSAR